MKSIQLLVFVVFFVAQSSSQDEEDGRRRPNYVVVDKHINVREIIRFGGKRDVVQDGVEEFEVPGDDNSAPYQSPFSSLLAKVSNAAKWRKVQNMLPLSGIQYFLGDMGTAEVCGRLKTFWRFSLALNYLFLLVFYVLTIGECKTLDNKMSAPS